jgi:hypothetical protein
MRQNDREVIRGAISGVGNLLPKGEYDHLRDEVSAVMVRLYDPQDADAELDAMDLHRRILTAYQSERGKIIATERWKQLKLELIKHTDEMLRIRHDMGVLRDEVYSQFGVEFFNSMTDGQKVGRNK